MSGGVDSSLAAFLLKEQGLEVIGATMCIGVADRSPGGPARCCGPEDVEDARRVALELGIPFCVVDVKEEFDRDVIQYFCREYMQGKTPNPCIPCNEKVKFRSFLKRAVQFGAEYIATGHYARLVFDEGTKRFLLKKGVDQRKDQSYVLFGLNQEQLSHVLFPLGGYRKEEVRDKAREIGLRVHSKPESQEICFIRDGSYHGFLSERLDEAIRPGAIKDREGRVLGRHHGIPFYTIGQRGGLGLAKGKPLYVIEIDPEENAIIVGEERETYEGRFVIDSIRWVDGSEPGFPLKVQVKIRYNHPGADAVVVPKEKGELEVKFETPQKAITPGQAAVFYNEETVLGGGRVQKVIRTSGARLQTNKAEGQSSKNKLSFSSAFKSGV